MWYIKIRSRWACYTEINIFKLYDVTSLLKWFCPYIKICLCQSSGIKKIKKHFENAKKKLKNSLFSFQGKILDFSIKIVFFIIFTNRDVLKCNHQIQREKLRLVLIFRNIPDLYRTMWKYQKRILKSIFKSLAH